MTPMDRLDRLIVLARETERLARTLEAAFANDRDARLTDAVLAGQIHNDTPIARSGVDRHTVSRGQDVRPRPRLVQPAFLAGVR